MILVTGCAGFIGFHLVNDLLSKKHKVIGIDNVNSYYEKKLKIDRINILKKFKNFIFIKKDLSNFEELKKSLKRLKFNFIIHLAAQPGVRFSLENPHITLSNNLVPFINILEIARIRRIKKGGCINLNRSWNNFKHIFINDINAGTKRVSKLTFSKSKSV